MHAPEVVIQLQNDLGRYLARTTKVVISLVPPYVKMCKVYCQVTWKNEERARRGQCQLTVQMNDWDIRTTTFLGLTCLWVSFLAKKKKKNSENGKKKKRQPEQTEGLWQFSRCCLHSNEELSKIHLAFEREWQRHEVSVSIRLEHQVISGIRPTDQRRSAGTTFSCSDEWFLQLTRSFSATWTRNSQLQRWDAAKRRFSFRFQKALLVYWETCLEKDTNECSCLICDFWCCRTSCFSVQPCTPKVLPNTETFLHSRVLFVTYVVPALCQIMYSLSVCSDGTTSAAPRSFRQDRPPARTLSLT